MTLLGEHPGIRFQAPDATTAPAPAEWRGDARDEVRLLVARRDGIVHTRFRQIPLAPRAGRPARRQRLRDRGSASPTPPSSGADRSSCTSLSDCRTAPGWWSSAPPRTRAARCSTPTGRRGGERPPATLARGAVPRHGVLTDRPGNRLWRATVTGDVAEQIRPTRPPHRVRLPRPALPARRLPVGLRGSPGQRGDAVSRPAVHLGPGRHAGRARDPIAPVTLHTGVSSQEAGEAPQPEWFEVSRRPHGSCKRPRPPAGGWSRSGRPSPAPWSPRRFPPVAAHTVERRAAGPSGSSARDHPPLVVDGLITGWHDPQASHLLLVEAVAGRALAQRAYDEAVAAGYLWHEFGDATLLLP